MPNRLALETSPYLLQHKNNPVDWFPWGKEALATAKALDRPILLSIGYSACHWCHVMERECFENASIAVQMNENFINIKVDREERPDLDAIYMNAVQSISGHGGWPLTVFLTPEGKPFHGGTYFPPVDRQGMPGFPKVLQAVSDAFEQQRDQIESASDRLVEHINVHTQSSNSATELTEHTIKTAYTNIKSQFDSLNGGLNGFPKFPQPMIYEFLLKHYSRTKTKESLHMVTRTLDKMANGGIYDHLGGGFHRYSTDSFWLVPHFEKMLYDNALLSKLYIHAYQVTGKDLYKNVVDETLNYVLTEMTSDNGSFFSAQDADSEGVEGKYFVWTLKEINEVLDPELANILTKYYDVTERGNFDGQTILNISHESSDQNDYALVKDKLDMARYRLENHRDKRIAPETDDKTLTAWNGLMISAFAEAAIVFQNKDYAKTAIKCANFLLKNMMVEDRLLRTYKSGEAKLNGYLEDYAFLIDGLLSIHETTLDPIWLNHARNLCQSMIDLFWDDSSKQFFDTSIDHEELIIRPREISDNAIPSGASIACKVLLKMAIYTDDNKIKDIAHLSIKSATVLMSKAPIAAGEWLSCLEFYIDIPKEIVINGDFNSKDTQDLLYEIYRSFIPNTVVLGINPDNTNYTSPLGLSKELLNGKPTAYVCQNYTCSLPINEPAELFEQLSTT